MTQESEFERLEEFVRRLLGRFDLLRDEKIQLEAVLQEKDREILGLKAELASADNERGDISSRVRGLLNQIEEWEKDLITDSVLSDSVETENSSKVVVEDNTDDTAEDGERNTEDSHQEDKEKIQQRNLFNVHNSFKDIGE